MKVRVHYNLRLFCFSVINAKTRKVISHEREVLLKNAKFVVSEAGRQRVLRDQVKNVHAWITGDWVRGEEDYQFCKYGRKKYDEVKVVYNPYKYKSFVRATSKRAIKKADFVLLEGSYALAFIKKEP